MSVDHLFMADACVTCQQTARVRSDAFNMNTSNIRAVPNVPFVGLGSSSKPGDVFASGRNYIEYN